MSADTLLINGKILRHGELIERCIAFQKGKICYVGKETTAPKAIERIDLGGKVVLPGLIDVHTHLRDLALADKEDFLTGTRSALSGGFTTVLDMPNSIPPTDNPENLKQKLDIAESKIVSNVGFYGAFSGDTKQVEDMAKIGIVGFKIFTTRRDSLNGDDDPAVCGALLSARSLGLPVAFHAEDLKTIEYHETRLKASKKSSLRAFSESHPPSAESASIARIVNLAEETKARVHFCHISTSKGLQLIKDAKRRGLSVTCEVAPHHLFLSEMEVHRQGGIAIVDPPLRGERHLRSLFKGLLQGDVDLVASDHAPHTLEEKLSENAWRVSPGFPGLETTLPVMLTAVKKGRLGLSRVVDVLSKRPADVFGLRSKGGLSSGYDADVTVVDLEKEFVIDPNEFESKAKYTPFKGFKAMGQAVKVFIAGRLAMEEGRITAKPGSGSIVRRVWGND